MKKLVVVVIAVLLALSMFVLACDTTSLEGTTWTGVVALTSVSVNFQGKGQYTSSHFGVGTYSVSGNQVTLRPSGQGQTRVFVMDGSLMVGIIDGWSTTLTKQ